MRLTTKPLGFLASAAVFAAAALAGTASAHDVFYSGRAVGVEGKIVFGPTSQRLLLADNFMSCRGKPKEETVYTFRNERPFIEAKTITTFTIGRDNAAQSQAATADYEIRLPSEDDPRLVIRAKLVESFAEARCDPATARVKPSGFSNIASLTINDREINISGEPNQEIPLPGGKLIINEQEVKQFKRAAEMRVTGLHLMLGEESGSHADLRISHTRAKTQCEKLVCPICPET